MHVLELSVTLHDLSWQIEFFFLFSWNYRCSNFQQVVSISKLKMFVKKFEHFQFRDNLVNSAEEDCGMCLGAP